MNSDIDASRVLLIFEELGYTLVPTEVGTAIVMNPENAFVFSLVTGASYLDDDYFPFTVKGLTKLFNSVFATEPIWGLVDGHNLGFTPKNIGTLRPQIFQGSKFVVPIDITNERESQDWLIRSRRSLQAPENFLMFRVETWKDGNGMEPLLEYLACHVFRNLGYFVETQIPLTASAGSPDFGGILDPTLSTLLNERLGRKTLGFHLIELAMLSNSGPESSVWPIPTYLSTGLLETCIVGEAKVGGSSPYSQLEKYFLTDFFNLKLALLDRRPSSTLPSIATLFVDQNNKVVFKGFRSSHHENRAPSQLANYIRWHQQVAKLYLLANLDSETLLILSNQLGKSKAHSPVKALLMLSQHLDFGEILDCVVDNI